jgi:hypothetical protein
LLSSAATTGVLGGFKDGLARWPALGAGEDPAVRALTEGGEVRARGVSGTAALGVRCRGGVAGGVCTAV